MPRPVSVFVCSACGGETLKWQGQCPACGEWNSLEQRAVRRPAPAKGGQGSIGSTPTGAAPVSLGSRAEPDLERLQSGQGSSIGCSEAASFRVR